MNLTLLPRRVEATGRWTQLSTFGMVEDLPNGVKMKNYFSVAPSIWTKTFRMV